jgi:hypothetical protein
VKQAGEPRLPALLRAEPRHAGAWLQRPLVPRIPEAILPLRYMDNARILLANPQVPKLVCSTCLL